MELIKKSKSKKAQPIVNEENSVVYTRLPEINLFLYAGNLNLKKNSFYKKSNEKLQEVITLAKDIVKTDKDYILGLSLWLSDRGLKTSPVILSSILADNKYSFGNPKQKTEFLQIFNTPRRISEAFALQDIAGLKLNNSFKKQILKPALENMKEHTLKKNKLKGKRYSLANLIKLLHPDFKTKQGFEFGKGIIENNHKLTSLNAKKEKENIVAVKSSNKLTIEEKKEILFDEENLKKAPINQLIRNLKFYAEQSDFKKNIELQQIILERLESFANPKSSSDFRFLNIFDVITAAIYVPQFEKMLFEIVKKYADEVKKEFEFGDEATALVDCSGSIFSGFSGLFSLIRDKEVVEAFTLSYKYLVLFSLIYPKLKIRLFSDGLWPESKTEQKFIEGIKIGAISTTYNKFREYANAKSGGTALLDSIKELCLEEEKNNINVPLICFSDEVSWEKEDLRNTIDDFDKLMNKTRRKLILVNPVATSGTVFRGNVVGISGISPNSIFEISILQNENAFIKYIRNYRKNG